jgi:hypothetical protein
MTQHIIPTIGSHGYYQIATPFDRLIVPSIRYTCQAVRTLKHYIAEGQDPFALFYQPQGVSQVEFDADFAINMSIVGLQAESGPLVYIPARYILTYPLLDGIAYREMMLGVALGSIPEAMDLSAISTRIRNVVQESLGIIPIITPVQISATAIVSSETNDRLTAARAALITLNVSDSARVIQLQALLDKQNTIVANLEKYIIDHYVENIFYNSTGGYYYGSKPKSRYVRAIKGELLPGHD